MPGGIGEDLQAALGVGGEGFLEIALLHRTLPLPSQNAAELVVGGVAVFVCVSTIQGQKLAKHRRGLLWLLGFLQGACQADQGVGMVGGQCQGLAVGRNGAVVVLVLLVRTAKAVGVVCLLGIEIPGLCIEVGGLGVVLGFFQQLP